jgi:hypothetical protein
VILKKTPVVYCSRADMIGTLEPLTDRTITSVTEADDAYVIEAAKSVKVALAKHPDPTGKVALCAARWANIVGAVDLRSLGKFGAATGLALSALQPFADDERAA